MSDATQDPAPIEGQDGRPDDAGHPSGRRRRGRAFALAFLVVLGITVALVVAVLMIFLRRQTLSYVTRWTGPPQESIPYEALPAEPDLHLVAVGDAGDAGSRNEAVAAAVTEVDAGRPVDILLLLGDNVYPRGDPADLPEAVLEPYARVLDDADLFAIIGNHDMAGDPDGQLQVLGMSGRFWSEERGDVLLVGLDSNRLDDAQLGWLDAVLRNSDATWKIVALHHPPYSAGYQGSSLGIRKRVTPVLERNGVQLVLSGHDHDWQRSRTIEGVNYVVTGSGSGTRRTSSEDFTANSFAWLGFADIGVYPDRLLLRSVSEDLEMSDMVAIAPDGTVTDLGANG